jgi:hypothetical protein
MAALDPDRPADPPDPKDANAIALKYLELARSEILQRQRLGDQILIVYIGAVGAIGAWVYSKGPSALAGGGLIPIGVVVAFLAFGASWIIYDNEHIINALARYQKRTLRKHFNHALPNIELWESSEELAEAANRRHSVRHNVIHGALLVLPGLVGLWLQWGYQRCHDRAFWIWMVMAVALTVAAGRLAFLTTHERARLRDINEDKSKKS